jgi:hypothetical protein
MKRGIVDLLAKIVSKHIDILSSASDIPTIFLESLLTTVETQTNLVVPK